MPRFKTKPNEFEANSWEGPQDDCEGVKVGMRGNTPRYYVETEPGNKVDLVVGEKVWVWKIGEAWVLLLDADFQGNYEPVDG